MPTPITHANPRLAVIIAGFQAKFACDTVESITHDAETGTYTGTCWVRVPNEQQWATISRSTRPHSQKGYCLGERTIKASA